MCHYLILKWLKKRANTWCSPFLSFERHLLIYIPEAAFWTCTAPVLNVSTLDVEAEMPSASNSLWIWHGDENQHACTKNWQGFCHVFHIFLVLLNMMLSEPFKRNIFFRLLFYFKSTKMYLLRPFEYLIGYPFNFNPFMIFLIVFSVQLNLMVKSFGERNPPFLTRSST